MKFSDFLFKRYLQNKANNAPAKNTVKTEKGISLPPGRVSVPNDTNNIASFVRGFTDVVNPSYYTELVPLLRDLYKVNPDISIALQDMFKLANTDIRVTFPNNTDKEALAMYNHLKEKDGSWSSYSAGIYGISVKMMVQVLIGGAISIECVPNKDLNSISNIVFVNPEDIRFKRGSRGEYEAYQIVRGLPYKGKILQSLIKLNPLTYKYVALYNDTDEPYGVPPFLGSLDSVKGQHDMKVNFKHIMELMGMVGFLEAKMYKPARKPDESPKEYNRRLSDLLRKLKINLINGMKDGVVTGFIDDHEFKLNSTTQSLQNVDQVWNMNQQSVANGLGVNGNLIGVTTNSGESGAGIMLSKMISQLRALQNITAHVIEFIYGLELRLAGYNVKGVKVKFATSTISDEIKVQQSNEYKVRVLKGLYDQGIISQEQFAWEMGYSTPDVDEPRIPYDSNTSNIDDSAKKRKRENDKDTSDRKTRDKSSPSGKRREQDSRPTGT